MNTIIKFFLFYFIFINQAFGYYADCHVEGLMERYDLSLKVENKVLANFGQKYTFIGRSGGWYVYGDESITFYLGPMYKPNHSKGIVSKQFRIELHREPSEFSDEVELGTCSIFIYK